MDEFESVGLGVATPICFNRCEKAAFVNGFGSGSMLSALIAERGRHVSLEVREKSVEMVSCKCSPSSFVNDARGSGVRCAAGRGRACGGGAALPGALVGNLRVTDWAGFDAFAPIVAICIPLCNLVFGRGRHCDNLEGLVKFRDDVAIAITSPLSELLLVTPGGTWVHVA